MASEFNGPLMTGGCKEMMKAKLSHAGRGVAAAGALLVVSGAMQSCALLGDCDLRVDRLVVTTLTGRVEPGQIASIIVPYDQGWSQNDVRVTWPDQGTPGGPLIKVYATSAACTNFMPPAENVVPNPTARPRGPIVEPRTAPKPRRIEDRPCEELGTRGGGYRADGVLMQNSLIVAGGPKQGTPDMHRYMLHVAGDPKVAVTYAIEITRPGCS